MEWNNSNKINIKDDNVLEYGVNCSIEDGFTAFIKAKENEGLTTRTIDEHKSHFRYFTTYLYQYKPQLIYLNDIKYEDIQDYITYMRTIKGVWDNHPGLKGKRNVKGLQPATVNTRIRTLKTQFNFWIKHRFIKINPCQDIKLLKTDRYINKIKAEHLKRLLAQPDRYGQYTGLRDYVVLLLLIDTGCRISQLLSVKTENINLFDNEMILPVGKNRREATVPFSEESKKWINLLLAENRKKGSKKEFLFLSRYGKRFTTDAFRKRLRKYVKNAGITVNIAPHKLRHYFATAFMKNGGSIHILSKLLTHKSIEATEIYVTDDFEVHKQMHSQKSPLLDIL